jgi:hypothetical protein
VVVCGTDRHFSRISSAEAICSDCVLVFVRAKLKYTSEKSLFAFLFSSLVVFSLGFLHGCTLEWKKIEVMNKLGDEELLDSRHAVPRPGGHQRVLIDCL